MLTTAHVHWYPAYIGIGSNLEDPVRQVEDAFGLLPTIRDTLLIKKSSLYRSAPFGGIEQPDFINAAAALLTQLTARELLSELKTLENQQGRVRDGARWGPRVLDLDLIVYSGQRIDDDDLIVPHPGIGERNFVLLPLAEVAAELHIPGLGRVDRLCVDMPELAIERLA